jgi:hypothetical protein
VGRGIELRVFSSASREGLDEQLAWENQGLGSTSVLAIQFLHDRRITPGEVVKEASAGGTRGSEQTVSIGAVSELSPNESSIGKLS